MLTGKYGENAYTGTHGSFLPINNPNHTHTFPVEHNPPFHLRSQRVCVLGGGKACVRIRWYRLQHAGSFQFHRADLCADLTMILLWHVRHLSCFPNRKTPNKDYKTAPWFTCRDTSEQKSRVLSEEWRGILQTPVAGSYWIITSTVPGPRNVPGIIPWCLKQTEARPKEVTGVQLHVLTEGREMFQPVVGVF